MKTLSHEANTQREPKQGHGTKQALSDALAEAPGRMMGLRPQTHMLQSWGTKAASVKVSDRSADVGKACPRRSLPVLTHFNLGGGLNSRPFLGHRRCGWAKRGQGGGARAQPLGRQQGG